MERLHVNPRLKSKHFKIILFAFYKFSGIQESLQWRKHTAITASQTLRSAWAIYCENTCLLNKESFYTPIKLILKSLLCFTPYLCYSKNTLVINRNAVVKITTSYHESHVETTASRNSDSLLCLGGSRLHNICPCNYRWFDRRCRRDASRHGHNASG